MRIAFFDFDRTLVAANTGKLWLRRELEAGRLTRLHALKASLWLGGYALGLAQLNTSLEHALRMLAGTPSEELEERTRGFYAREVKSLYRPGARVALEAHRAQGDRLVLLTTSLDVLARIVAEELRLDAQLSTRLEVDERGLHTGKAIGAVCFGPGKLTQASAYAEAVGASLSDCAFYTDSFSDLPVLEQVGAPVAVNPDLRLWRHATRRGWEIVDWGSPV